MASINQTGAGIRLPNFCNLGVMLRVLVVANLLVGAGAVLRARQASEIAGQLVLGAAFAEPVLIVSLVLLCAGRRLLHGLPYAGAIAAVLALELALCLGWAEVFSRLFPDAAPASRTLVGLLALLATGAALAYFDLRARAQSPAIAEARIQALQARIRPHFLFNSINAVLSLIRSEPRRAERALEDLADLFRVLMGDARTLAPLAKDVELASQYLAIESLRLGDRLRVRWEVDAAAREALVPALLLQPLVENAVYHGIEPLGAGGEIAISASVVGQELRLRVTNPVPRGGNHHSGNRLALDNIRERLQLHYDAEASLQSRQADGQYEVAIRLPLVPAGSP